MMQNKPSHLAVVGVFSDRQDAERAITDLESAGFRDDQIGILTRPDRGAGAATTRETGSKAGEGAATGAVVGGILGAAASLLIPGVGPVIAGGILATVLGSAAVGAAAGGVLGGLVGLGVPEDEARYYEGEFKAGRTIVTVKADGRYDEALAILRHAGAYDVHDRPTASTMGSGLTDTAHPSTGWTDTTRTTGTSLPGKETRVPLTEEERKARQNRS